MLPPLFTAGSHQTASVSTAIGILSLKSFCCSSQFFTYPQQYFNVVNGCHSAAAYLHFCVRCRAPECIRRNRICASHRPATLCCAVVLLLLSFTAFASFLCLMRMSERFCFCPLPPQFWHYPHYNKRFFICQDCFPVFARFLRFLISFLLLILKILLFYKFIFQIFKISVPFFLCFFWGRIYRFLIILII